MKKWNIEIKWALIFIVAEIAWVIIEKLLGWHDEHIEKQGTFGFMVPLMLLLTYIFGLLEKRRKYYGGRMPFLKGFTSGLIITAIIVLSIIPGNYLMLEIISPDYFSNQISHLVQTGVMSQKEAEASYNLSSFNRGAIPEVSVVGIVFSAIMALILSWKRKSL